MARRQARQARCQCQEAGGPGHRQQPAMLQQPQDVGSGEGFGRGGGCPLLQVSALVLLLFGAAVLEPDLHLGRVRAGASGRQRGQAKQRGQVGGEKERRGMEVQGYGEWGARGE